MNHSLEMTKQEDGGYYALPYSRNYMGVFYNMDIFEENSLEIPETWDDFVKLCDTVKAAGITPVGLFGKDSGKSGTYLPVYNRGMGAKRCGDNRKGGAGRSEAGRRS